MKKIFSIAVLAVLVAGCVTGYKSMDEVPAREKPFYEATYAYMDCSLNQYVKLMGEKPELKAGEVEAGVTAMAEKACAACEAELDAYSAFVKERSGDAELAEKLSAKLHDLTREKMVDLVMDWPEE